MNSILTKSAPIQETISALQNQLVPCPLRHPFLKLCLIEKALGNYLETGSVGDVNCSGHYIRAMRDSSDVVHNAVVSKLTEAGKIEYVFIPSAPHMGLFVQYGKIEKRIILTVNDVTAALIYSCMSQPTVAVLYLENLEAVCTDLIATRPKVELIIAIDFKKGETSQDVSVLDHAMAVASRHQLKLALSGTATSFLELRRQHGRDAIKTQIEHAAVPVISTEDCERLKLDPFPQAPATVAQNGSSLMFDLVAAVRRHLVVSNSSAILIALWSVYTHLFRNFALAPYLAITSPEKGCGKTNLLTLLERLCFKPFITSNISTAAIYRAIDQESGTLLIDEADTFLPKKGPMVGILNSGYKRKTALVARNGKDGVEKKSTFCPKAIAMIGEMPETLKDRSIQIRLERKSPDEKVHPIAEDGPDEISLLRARLLRWVADNGKAVADVKPEPLQLDNDRAQDNAMPLLAVATVLGGKWLERTRLALEEHGKEISDTLSTGEWLLSDIAQAFAISGRLQLLTKELLTYLNQQEEAPWPKFSRGKPLDARDLSLMLKRFGIASTQMRHGNGQVGRGYFQEQFSTAFGRYVKNKPVL